MPIDHTQLSLKEKQRLERENLILQAAEEIFTEKGFYEASMDEIAARVGIAKGTLYLHFASKEKLSIAIFTREMEHLVEEVEAMSALETTARIKLERLLINLLSGMHRKRSQMFMAAYSDIDKYRLLSENKTAIHELWGRLTRSISTLLEEGKASGIFNPALPTEVMLLAFISFLSPKTTERLIAKDAFSPEELVGYLGNIFFDGITAKEEIL
jgi:AcrR family transcriptional regulator